MIQTAYYGLLPVQKFNTIHSRTIILRFYRRINISETGYKYIQQDMGLHVIAERHKTLVI